MNELSYLELARLKRKLVNMICEEISTINTLEDLKISMLKHTPPEGVRNIVFGEGTIECEIMFIGEAPGETEDETGRPFVGKSGQLLRNIIKFIGKTFYITNTIPYRPPLNRNPTTEEIEFWKPYLIEHIKIVNPKNIILVGKVAVQALLGKHDTISKLRLNEYEFMNKKTFIFYHPSYLIRFPTEKRSAYEDVKFILSRMD